MKNNHEFRYQYQRGDFLERFREYRKIYGNLKGREKEYEFNEFCLGVLSTFIDNICDGRRDGPVDNYKEMMAVLQEMALGNPHLTP